MRILFVTPTLPVPTSGGRTRLFNLIKHLSKRHDISVIAFLQPAEDELLPQLRPHCNALELVPFAGFTARGPWGNRLHGWKRILLESRPSYVTTFPVGDMRLPLRNLLAQQPFDLVIFEQLFLVELVDELGHHPVMLVEQNVESEITNKSRQRSGNPAHKLRDWLVWRKLYRFEKRWVSRFPVVVAVSDSDAALLREMAPDAEIHVVPNGVDSQAFAPVGSVRAGSTLLFFGTLSYSPNQEGLIWFCQEVLPRVRNVIPEVELRVVGLNPPPNIQDLGRLPGVNMIGFVSDICSELWSATASVVPLFVGGGTRLKILEALAAHCPIVSTTIGAEGLDLIPGHDFLIADDAQSFAESVVRVLQDRTLRDQLANNGYRSVIARYDWRYIVGEMELACMRAIEKQEPDPSNVIH